MAKPKAQIEKEQADFAARQLTMEDEEQRRGMALRLVNEDIEDIEHDEYAELFAGLGESAEEKVLLYRIAPGSQKQGLLCRLDPGTSVEDIKPRFGGGDYVIKRLRSGMIMKSARLFVEGDPIYEQPKPKEEAVAAQAGGIDIAALMHGLHESNRQMLAGIVEVMRPQQGGKMEMLKELSMFKELFAQPQQVQQTNPMDMFIKGMEMAREIQPKAPGETSGMDVLLEAVKGFAPAIGDITQKLAVQQAQIPQQTVQLSNHTQPLQQVQQSGNDMLKFYLNILVGYAKAGKDATLYAELVADNMTDQQLAELFAQPDLIASLGAIHPGVLENRAWFETLIKELREIVDLTENPVTPSVSENLSANEGLNANIGNIGNTDTMLSDGNQ